MSEQAPGLDNGAKDFLRVVGLCLGYLPSFFIPNAFDRRVIDALTSMVLKLRPGKEPALAKRMAETLGRPESAFELEAEARHRYQHSLEAPWARVRSLHRDGWKPEVTLEGLERIRASQEKGKGTVLWRMSTGSPLALKRALWQAGIGIVHLSTQIHGSWSDGWVALNALAPLYRRTEKWYLKERVLIPTDRAMARIMKTLLTRLKANEVVTIVGDLRGGHNVEVPFLGERAWFAIGSPALAWKAGSTLLPTYCVREGTGRFRVVVDEPIEPDRSLERRAFVDIAVKEFAQRLEGFIAEHPGSWESWTKFWNRYGSFDPAEDPLVGA